MSDVKEFSILIVDDESDVLFSYSTLFRSAGFSGVKTENDSRKVMAMLDEEETPLVLLDLQMPHIGGYELLQQIRERHPSVQVIIVTAANEIEMAVSCIKAGAIDYCVKPVEKNRLIATVRRAEGTFDRINQLEYMRAELLGVGEDSAFNSMIACSEKMRSIIRYLSAVARSRQPVLICGETGTGKELAARGIHDASGRSGEFVAVNLAGVDDQMMCDTLFGHLRGAYSGATEKRGGLVARAAGGTLFLDEIGDLSMQSQVKLLRLLQEGEYLPLGSDIPRRSDIRVIAATNCDLPSMIDKGTFRIDLYYRLCTHQVTLPPLRERVEDLPVLLSHFIAEAARDLHKTPPVYPPQLITYLETAKFPGNIRQLQGVVRNALACHTGGILSMEPFLNAIGVGSNFQTENKTKSTQMFALPDGTLPTLKQAEEILINQALELASGNQGVAARYLGISRQALNKRLKS